jgi:hypothetical protein
MGFYLFSSATFAPFARGKSFQHAKKLTVSSAENAEEKVVETEETAEGDYWITGLHGLGNLYMLLSM